MTEREKAFLFIGSPAVLNAPNLVDRAEAHNVLMDAALKLGLVEVMKDVSLEAFAFIVQAGPHGD